MRPNSRLRRRVRIRTKNQSVNAASLAPIYPQQLVVASNGSNWPKRRRAASPRRPFTTNVSHSRALEPISRMSSVLVELLITLEIVACSTHVALEQIVLRATHQPSIGLGHQVQVWNAPRRVVEAQSSRNIRLIRALPRGSSRTVKTSQGWAEIHLFAHAILVGAAQHFLAAVGRRLELRKLARMLTLFHGRGYNSTSIHRPIFGRSVEAQSFC